MKLQRLIRDKSNKAQSDRFQKNSKKEIDRNFQDFFHQAQVCVTGRVLYLQ